MKPSHRKDVIIARIIFAGICIALIAVIAAIIVVIASHRKPDVKETQTESQTNAGDDVSAYVPGETQTV